MVPHVGRDHSTGPARLRAKGIRHFIDDTFTGQKRDTYSAPSDVVTVRDLCDICQCGHSSGGRGRCPDLHGRTLIVGRSSEMDGVQHLELANATAITFNKAALSVGRSLEVSLTNCSRVTFSTGSLRLSRPTAELTFAP